MRKDYKKDMNVDEGIKLCLKIFKEVLGDKFDVGNFNVSVIRNDDAKMKKLGKGEIEKYG